MQQGALLRYERHICLQCMNPVATPTLLPLSLPFQSFNPSIPYGQGEGGKRGVPRKTNKRHAPVQDGRVDLKLTGAMIGKGVKCIFDHCCKQEYTGTKYNNGQSGQKFYSGFGSDFNIAVGYGNCGDPVEIRPNNALGWGVNPQCVGGIQVPNPDCSLS